MEEINLKTLFNYIIKRYKLLLNILVPIFILSIIYTFTFNLGKYEATAQVSINTSDINGAKSLTTIYADKVITDSNLNEVISDLNLNTSVSKLSSKLSATSEDTSDVIYITILDNNKENSYKTVNKLANVFIDNMYDLGITNLVVTSSAVKPSSRNVSFIDHLKDIIVIIIIVAIVEIIVMFIKYYFDSSVKSIDDIEKNTKLKVYGVVPKDNLDSNVVNESIRNIKDNITINSNSNIIGITSVSKNAGVSTIVKKLAYSYANDNKKVLVIDLDLNKGNIDELFNIKNNKGYHDLILKEDKVSNYINKCDNKNISVITKGSNNSNEVNILSSEYNKKVLDTLKEEYDIILLDMPVSLGITGSIIISKLVDTNIIVVEDEHTNINDIKVVNNILEENNISSCGVVINKNNMLFNNYPKYYTFNYYEGDK